MKSDTANPIIQKKLFSLIRAGLDIETDSPALSEEDCSAILSIGARQSILPILYRGLKKLGAPETVIRECDNARMKNVYDSIQQDNAIQTITDALEEQGITYVLLKGAVLRNLYPSPELRTSCDLDVLAHEEELEAAVRTLEARTDFKARKLAYHDISMVSPNVHLELHFSIKENMENIDQLLGRAWEYAEPYGEGSRYEFSPEFQIFHVIAHMNYHFVHGGLGIRPFLDLWLLRHKTQYDEDTVRNMCSECGILTFYEECCTLSEVWLGKAEHTETSRMLEEFCLSGGVFGSDEFKNVRDRREAFQFKYMLRRVFPPASHVKGICQDPSGKSHSLPYYYAKYIISWFGKRGRRDIKNKLSRLVHKEQTADDSDEVEELFQRLGL